MPLEVFPHVYVSRITASMFCTFQYLESLPPVLPECGKDKRCGIYHEVLLLDCGSFQFVSNKGMQLLRMGCLTERSSARLYQYFWDYAHTKGPPSYLDDLKIQRRPVWPGSCITHCIYSWPLVCVWFSLFAWNSAEQRPHLNAICHIIETSLLQRIDYFSFYLYRHRTKIIHLIRSSVLSLSNTLPIVLLSVSQGTNSHGYINCLRV